VRGAEKGYGGMISTTGAEEVATNEGRANGQEGTKGEEQEVNQIQQKATSVGTVLGWLWRVPLYEMYRKVDYVSHILFNPSRSRAPLHHSHQLYCSVWGDIEYGL
jgi:hypothetical protein